MPGLDATIQLVDALSDPTRVRLLSVLEGRELSVAELTSIVELAQGRVSDHLARLKAQGLVADRKSGRSTMYRAAGDGMPQAAVGLWRALRESLADRTLEADRTLADRIVKQRNSAGWPEALAGEMEHHYSPGRTWDSLARAFLGLLRTGDVLDLGSGDGAVAELLAPRARSITCVDKSPRMLEAAARRLGARDNVRLVHGDVSSLPFSDEQFDDVLMLNVLTCAEQPVLALSEAARVLKRRGQLVLVTLDKHDELEVTSAYGHRHAGFEPRWLKKRLIALGLSVELCEITSRERRRPNFRVITCYAKKA